MFFAAIKKDVWLLLRDRGSLIRLFAVPVIFITVFGSMFKFGGPNKGKPQQIAIWHAPDDARGVAIEKLLAATEGFEVQAAASADDVRDRVRHESVRAGLIIPADFDPAHGKPIELVIDLEAAIQMRAPLQGALTGVAMRALAPMQAAAAPMVAVRAPPGAAKQVDEISGFQITVPGNAVLFGFFIVITVALSFASERRTGTWRRVLSAPVPRWKILLATLVPYYLVGLLQLTFLFGIGIGAFGMHVAGSWAGMILLSMAVALCAVSLGLMFASLGGSEKQIGGVGSMTLLVMALLGGCMFPRIAMPELMQKIGNLVPHSWALDGYYAAIVKQGTTLADVAPSIGALLAFSVGFASIGLWRFRFEK
jgi:ABC-2 type transport system permease protein